MHNPLRPLITCSHDTFQHVDPLFALNSFPLNSAPATKRIRLDIPFLMYADDVEASIKTELIEFPTSDNDNNDVSFAGGKWNTDASSAITEVDASIKPEPESEESPTVKTEPEPIESPAGNNDVSFIGGKWNTDASSAITEIDASIKNEPESADWTLDESNAMDSDDNDNDYDKGYYENNLQQECGSSRKRKKSAPNKYSASGGNICQPQPQILDHSIFGGTPSSRGPLEIITCELIPGQASATPGTAPAYKSYNIARRTGVRVTPGNSDNDGATSTTKRAKAAKPAKSAGPGRNFRRSTASGGRSVSALIDSDSGSEGESSTPSPPNPNENPHTRGSKRVRKTVARAVDNVVSNIRLMSPNEKPHAIQKDIDGTQEHLARPATSSGVKDSINHLVQRCQRQAVDINVADVVSQVRERVSHSRLPDVVADSMKARHERQRSVDVTADAMALSGDAESKSAVDAVVKGGTSGADSKDCVTDCSVGKGLSGRAVDSWAHGSNSAVKKHSQHAKSHVKTANMRNIDPGHSEYNSSAMQSAAHGSTSSTQDTGPSKYAESAIDSLLQRCSDMRSLRERKPVDLVEDDDDDDDDDDNDVDYVPQGKLTDSSGKGSTQDAGPCNYAESAIDSLLKRCNNMRSIREQKPVDIVKDNDDDADDYDNDDGKNDDDDADYEPQGKSTDYSSKRSTQDAGPCEYAESAIDSLLKRCNDMRSIRERKPVEVVKDDDDDNNDANDVPTDIVVDSVLRGRDMKPPTSAAGKSNKRNITPGSVPSRPAAEKGCKQQHTPIASKTTEAGKPTDARVGDEQEDGEAPSAKYVRSVIDEVMGRDVSRSDDSRDDASDGNIFKRLKPSD